MEPTTLDYEELKQEIIQQLEKSRFGVLATAEGNFVTARQMMLICDGLKVSLLTTNWNRKYKQISANKNVALAINNIQIEGVASIKGRTSDPENAGFLKAFEELFPELYKLYRDFCNEPDTIYHVIEVIPTRIALFYGGPEVHLDVLNVGENSAIRHNWTLGKAGNPNY